VLTEYENRIMADKLVKIRIKRKAPYYASFEGSVSATLPGVAERLVKEGYAEYVEEKKSAPAVKKAPVKKKS